VKLSEQVLAIRWAFASSDNRFADAIALAREVAELELVAATYRDTDLSGLVADIIEPVLKERFGEGLPGDTTRGLAVSLSTLIADALKELGEPDPAEKQPALTIGVQGRENKPGTCGIENCLWPAVGTFVSAAAGVQPVRVCIPCGARFPQERIVLDAVTKKGTP